MSSGARNGLSRVKCQTHVREKHAICGKLRPMGELVAMWGRGGVPTPPIFHCPEHADPSWSTSWYDNGLPEWLVATVVQKGLLDLVIKFPGDDLLGKKQARWMRLCVYPKPDGLTAWKDYKHANKHLVKSVLPDQGLFIGELIGVSLSGYDCGFLAAQMTAEILVRTQPLQIHEINRAAFGVGSRLQSIPYQWFKTSAHYYVPAALVDERVPFDMKHACGCIVTVDGPGRVAKKHQCITGCGFRRQVEERVATGAAMLKEFEQKQEKKTNRSKHATLGTALVHER